LCKTRGNKKCNTFDIVYKLLKLALVSFFCFRTGFRSTKGGRLIWLVRRGMRTGQTLFLRESNPVFRSSFPLEPKQLAGSNRKRGTRFFSYEFSEGTLCNKMSDQCLNDRLVTYIERDVFGTIDNDIIIAHF
jgi:hypothetical protein